MSQSGIGRGLCCTAFLDEVCCLTDTRSGATGIPWNPAICGVDRRGQRTERLDAPQDGLEASNRRQAEALAERWKPQAPSKAKLHRELFCTPILLTFEDGIPESSVDLALRMANRRLDFRAQLYGRLRDRELIPAVVLDDLFPMCQIKRATLAQVERAVRTRSVRDFRSATSSWSRTPATPMRQSPAFLYYLVGIHTGAHLDSLDQDGGTFERLSENIARFVTDAISIETTVQMRLFRGFFEGLFEGIWMYQDARLTQVAALAVKTAGKRAICVQVCPETSTSMVTHSILLHFCGGDSRGRFGKWLRVTGRPGDDLSVSVARIVRVLEFAGVKRIETTEATYREDRIATRMSGRTAADSLSVPL